MADVVFSDSERKRIAGVLHELATTFDDFAEDIRENVADDEWALIVEYMTARVRTVLEVATSLHAVCDAQEDLSWTFPGRGRETFVRAALKAWGDSYAVIPDPWRIAMVFTRVPGGEKRFLADVVTLETMALNRLFDSIEDQFERLLAADG